MHVGGGVVAVWYPTTGRPAKYAYTPNFSGFMALNAAASAVCGKRVPLVVFSHGDLGCGLQSTAFTEELRVGAGFGRHIHRDKSRMREALH